jgi:hypothetical protein
VPHLRPIAYLHDVVEDTFVDEAFI